MGKREVDLKCGKKNCDDVTTIAVPDKVKNVQGWVTDAGWWCGNGHHNPEASENVIASREKKD